MNHRISEKSAVPGNQPVCGVCGLEKCSTACRIRTRVVGVTFNHRQRIVADLFLDEMILLRREPENIYDANAIRVERLSGEQFGYLDRSLAARLAPFLDELGEPIYGQVTLLMGDPFKGLSMGVMITFSLPCCQTLA